MKKVYKFGGASVKDAANIIRLSKQLKADIHPHKVVVISALGKMTNAFEVLVNAYYDQKRDDIAMAYRVIYDYHYGIIADLFERPQLGLIDQLFEQLAQRIEEVPSMNFDYEYDQIVSFGEILSTTLISEYLNFVGVKNSWIDIRPVLRTSENYREGNVDWNISSQNIQKQFVFTENHSMLYITQGFIASTYTNLTTTLGREGSDYSAAIIAHCLNAMSVTIWKDVEGVLNADPRYFEVSQKIERISYKDAIELAYFGASVIHPKTLKPLRTKQIPLYVRSFVDPTLSGTMIGNGPYDTILPPIYILKRDQVLITISDRDLSFLSEEDIAFFYQTLSEHQAKSNLVQQSALYFSVVIDKNHRQFEEMVGKLMENYKVMYNQNLELLTIQNSEPKLDNLDYIQDREVLIEQHSRKTSRYLVKQ
ncbi:aspartate kinase [Halosquirtibacter xylanolyticus]|uniref:aspartate kinase n=1 Tax=Halosquirtibacter xylanolyticus TaxID=3374599 RepID=UPI003748279E|nr:aspartate kinase [Prolixibacteraceae bacterium]